MCRFHLAKIVKVDVYSGHHKNQAVLKRAAFIELKSLTLTCIPGITKNQADSKRAAFIEVKSQKMTCILGIIHHMSYCMMVHDGQVTDIRGGNLTPPTPPPAAETPQPPYPLPSPLTPLGGARVHRSARSSLLPS